MTVTSSTEWLADKGDWLIDNYRDEAAQLNRQFEVREGSRQEAIAELVTSAREHARRMYRLADDLADLAGSRHNLPRVLHREELEAEVRAGEHRDDD